MLWVPIFMSLGIVVYFELSFEPEFAQILPLCAAFACGVLLQGALPEVWRPICGAFLCVVLGLCLSWGRTQAVSAPILDFRYYGAVEGRVVAMDRSASDKIRLTLDRVRLERMSPEDTPERVRVSLHGQQDWLAVQPGQRIMMTAHLSPPGGALEPGGFDFARHAFFLRLGAQGYTRTPVLLAAPAQNSWRLMLFEYRMKISAHLQARIPGDAGGFAAAILTGDRSAVSTEVVEVLRDANTAHLLAISGLHMGLLTGTVFTVIWTLVAAIPWLALRVSGAKIAACVALLAGAVYLALSGGAVSTQRAYVMVCVMLVAILLDKRAISLRAVAIAAILVLAWRPESLFSPGFQMSFAATTALVAVFSLLRGLPGRRFWMHPVVAVILSSAVAGAATAPFSAAHFNQVSQLGLIANTLSVPVMGVLVMPAGVAAMVLAALGLEGLALVPMQWGLEWILFVSQRVAEQDISVRMVVEPGPWALGIVSLGALIVIVWQGPLRWAGGLVCVFGALLWQAHERPPILIAPSGGLVGAMTAEGRAFSKPRGDGFAARIWLENDGDGSDQAEAAARQGFSGPKDDRLIRVQGVSIRVLSGRNQAERITAGCKADIVVATRPPEAIPKGCVVFGPDALKTTGALAIWPLDDGTWVQKASYEPARARPWAVR